MNKKMKIAYYVVMALNTILCIVDLATANYTGAILTGVTVAWMIINLKLIRLLDDAVELLDDYSAATESLATKLKESKAREGIAIRNLNEMRERAESAEKQLKELMDDTPARGEDGRFIKRE